MKDAHRDYWTECIEIAFEEERITATQEQIDNVAGAVESGHENYGMAFPSPPSIDNEERESKRLKRELEVERNKIICTECGGHGSITTLGPIHSATSSCHKCNGEGRHTP